MREIPYSGHVVHRRQKQQAQDTQQQSRVWRHIILREYFGDSIMFGDRDGDGHIEQVLEGELTSSGVSREGEETRGVRGAIRRSLHIPVAFIS